MQALDSPENPATDSAIRPTIAIIFFIQRKFTPPFHTMRGGRFVPFGRQFRTCRFLKTKVPASFTIPNPGGKLVD
jgi:hypothetical protein